MTTHRVIKLLLLLAAIACLVWLMATPPAKSEDATPSPSAVQASDELVTWSLHWRRIARRCRAEAAWPRTCLGLSTARLAARPERSASAEEWTAAGRAWKHSRARWQRLERRALSRLRHPGGSGAARWWPAARYVGWPAGTRSTLVRIMTRESRGNPRILCGGYILPRSAGDGKPNRRAGGLMQCKPAPRHWADPIYNLWYALHRKYLPALRAWGNGWQPWAM
jgi:hypothetical protein